MTPHNPEACETCLSRPIGRVERLGLNLTNIDYVVALAGNPNTGKSTVFNRLTGLRQHTGNWPGKTISRAEGAFAHDGKRYKIVDLPGTYSLRSASPDETVAREFILFGRPDVTVIVLDASSLERNLNLALQVLQITDRAVVCLNLMDEARANGLKIDVRRLARELGVPVVPCSARSGEGIDVLLAEMRAVATGAWKANPYQMKLEVPGLAAAQKEVRELLDERFPGTANLDWVAQRLLEGDRAVMGMVEDEALGRMFSLGEKVEEADKDALSGKEIVRITQALRWRLPRDFNDRLTEAIYAESSRIAGHAVVRSGAGGRTLMQERLDRLLTSPLTGFPIMGLAFAILLWITIIGSNYPSSFLSWIFVENGYPFLRELAFANLWPWLAGLLVDGMYLSTVWVISVMLPPMMIFFPVFTLLEDFGYLPRVAFNLDRMFSSVGAHGKQALTMAMGYGCNAAGIVASRVIDSPRERLIAIVTNNFAICNGRWPTLILMSTIFLGSLVPQAFSGVVAAGAVFCVAVLGFLLSLLSSLFLSRTMLKGVASTFSLELPPYRPPNIWRTLYTSIIDRTIFVLWRAVMFALPAGAVIWLVANVTIGDSSLAGWLVGGLDPIGWWLGLNGIILLAYVIAIPANEVVIPTVLMLTVLLGGSAVGLDTAGMETGVLFEAGDNAIKTLLTGAGWTVLTGVCLMLFSLCHNPCSTTLYTIYKETGSWKWMAVSAILPLIIGSVICAGVAGVWRLLG